MLEEIFIYQHNEKKDKKILINVSMAEIYNEKIFDLLNENK